MKLMKEMLYAASVFALLGGVTYADPGDTVFVNTTNITGGEDLDGFPITLEQGLDLFVVEIGNYTFGGVDAGYYFYYPSLDLTIFAGVATGAPLPPGRFVTSAGIITSDDIVIGSSVVSVGNELDGVHIFEASEVPEVEPQDS